MELWGEGASAEEAGESVKAFPEERKAPFYADDVTWSVTVRETGPGSTCHTWVSAIFVGFLPVA